MRKQPSSTKASREFRREPESDWGGFFDEEPPFCASLPSSGKGKALPGCGFHVSRKFSSKRLSRFTRMGIYCCSATAYALGNRMRLPGDCRPARGGLNEDQRHGWIGAQEQGRKGCVLDCPRTAGLRSPSDHGTERHWSLAGP